jgi:uncharacterized RDD family membrane protein YckC
MPSYPQSPGGGSPPQFPPPSFATPGAMPYAGWGIRLGGWLIDAVILFLVRTIFGALLSHSNALVYRHTSVMTNGTVRHLRINFLVIILALIVGIVYATVMIAARGQTVGMMAVGIRAVCDPDFGQVGAGAALGRALMAEVLAVTVIGWFLDWLWPLWDKKNQTLHDKVAGTVVLRVRNTG